MSEQQPKCSICGEPAYGFKAQLRPKCALHFACACAECGHEAMWITTKDRPEGRWICFSLDCDWESETYTTPAFEL